MLCSSFPSVITYNILFGTLKNSSGFLTAFVNLQNEKLLKRNNLFYSALFQILNLSVFAIILRLEIYIVFSFK